MTVAVAGVFAVVPTAFHDDGTLDRGGVAALVDAYGEAGVDGFVVLAAMGEGPLLDEHERQQVIATAAGAAGGLPVAVGVSGPDQLAAARSAVATGAEALLASLPGGDSTRRREQLAELAVLGPSLMVQHYPAATGAQLAPAEVAALVTELPVVALTAEAPPTPDVIAAVMSVGGPACLGGLSALYLLEELEAGAAGCMSGLAAPERLVEVVRAWQVGEPARTHEAYLQLAGWLRLETMPGTVGLAVRKEAWRQRGAIGSSRIRRGEPLGAATKVAITRRLQELGLPTPAGVVLG